MATQVKNDKGFLVIKMNVQEAIGICKFGFGNLIICDNCNNSFDDEDELYYVAVLNRAFCKECYGHWYSYATRYNEDIPYEERHFNMYAKKLNIAKAD